MWKWVLDTSYCNSFNWSASKAFSWICFCVSVRWYGLASRQKCIGLSLEVLNRDPVFYFAIELSQPCWHLRFATSGASSIKKSPGVSNITRISYIHYLIDESRQTYSSRVPANWEARFASVIVMYLSDLSVWWLSVYWQKWQTRGSDFFRLGQIDNAIILLLFLSLWDLVERTWDRRHVVTGRPRTGTRKHRPRYLHILDENGSERSV